MVNGLKSSPCAHYCGTPCLVCKLQFIQSKRISIKKDHHPVKELKEDTADCHTPVVLTAVDAGQLVLDQGDEGGEQKDQRHM